MANISEEKMNLLEKNILEAKIKDLKINTKSKLIKNIGHTSLKLVILSTMALNVASIAAGYYFQTIFLATNVFCFYINCRIYKGEWKDYYNDKKNLKMLKQSLEDLKNDINLIDTEAVLISDEDTESYQKHK